MAMEKKEIYGEDNELGRQGENDASSVSSRYRYIFLVSLFF
jgi:hypothetical protein